MAHKHIKRYPNFSLIRKMQIKTTVRYYFLPTRLEKIINKLIIYYFGRETCTISPNTGRCISQYHL